MNDVRFALRTVARNRGSTALIPSLLPLGTGAKPEPAEEITVYGVTPEFFDAPGVRPLIAHYRADRIVYVPARESSSVVCSFERLYDTPSGLPSIPSRRSRCGFGISKNP